MIETILCTNSGKMVSGLHWFTLVYTANNVHESYDHFIDIITKLYNECYPVTKIATKREKKNHELKKV